MACIVIYILRKLKHLRGEFYLVDRQTTTLNFEENPEAYEFLL